MKNVENYVKNVLGISNSSTQVGAVPNASMKHTNGLDDIDKWAMGVGNSERQLNGMRPKRRHNYCL